LMFSVAKAPLPLTVEALMTIAPLLMAGRFFLSRKPMATPTAMPEIRTKERMTGRLGSISFFYCSDALDAATENVTFSLILVTSAEGLSLGFSGMMNMTF